MDFLRGEVAESLNEFCLFHGEVSSELEKELGTDIQVLADFKKMCHIRVITSGFDGVNVIFV